MKTLIALVAASLIMNVVTLGVVVTTMDSKMALTEEQKLHEAAVNLYNMYDCKLFYDVHKSVDSSREDAIESLEVCLM